MTILPVQPQTVTQLNRYLRRLLDGDRNLRDVTLRGEISNFKHHSSGHLYFSLKDAESSIPCVMYRDDAVNLRFEPESGMSVIASGNVTVYLRDGKYQLVCTALQPDGVGALYIAFEQLKQKLNEEGLFAQQHKKPLPRYPDSIAVITASTGAAIHDVLRILRARWPMTKVKLMGVHVQGERAPLELASAVRYANKYKVADLIIIGRGGGSMEDLWAFNDERLAREIYRSEIPVISAVGHEPDVVITDFTADCRAATPSNAAELAVPDQEEIMALLRKDMRRLCGAMDRTLTQERSRLSRCTESFVLKDPARLFRDEEQHLDGLCMRLDAGMDRKLQNAKSRYGSAVTALEAMSPLKVLARGYALAENQQGTVIASVGQAAVGDKISVRVADGRLECDVTGIRGCENESEKL